MITGTLQLARETEAGRAMGDTVSHLYTVKDVGFKPAIAFKDAQEQVGVLFLCVSVVCVERWGERWRGQG